MGNRFTASPHKSIFEISVEDANSEAIAIESFRGKKCYIVVNVASQ